MVVENVKAALHEAAQHLFLGQPGTGNLGQMVMGRFQGANLAMLPHHDVAVAGAGVELEGFVIECFPDGIHQNVGIGGGDFAGGVIHNGFLGVGFFLREGDHIAPEDHIVWFHFHAHTQGFQGRSSGKIGHGIITHNGQIGNFTAGGHTQGYVLHHAHFTAGGQSIHGGGGSGFQRCQTTQGFHGLVGHAVAQDNDILHHKYSFRNLRP